MEEVLDEEREEGPGFLQLKGMRRLRACEGRREDRVLFGWGRTS